MAGRVLREDGDAAKRVRRAIRVIGRNLDALEKFARDIERGRVPDGVDPGVLLGLIEKWIDVLGRGEDRLCERQFEEAGGVPGRAAPMDLAAARDDVMGRLARLAGQDAP